MWCGEVATDLRASALILAHQGGICCRHGQDEHRKFDALLIVTQYPKRGQEENHI